LFSWGSPLFANREKIELLVKETREPESDRADVITNDVLEFKMLPTNATAFTNDWVRQTPGIWQRLYWSEQKLMLFSDMKFPC
jgi:hypothetical protein